MKLKIKSNLVTGIVMGVFSIVMLILTPMQVRLPMYDSGAPSPRIIPSIALVGTLICSIVLIIQSLIFKKEKIVEFDSKTELPCLVLIGLFCLYVFLMLYLGFVVSSIIIFSAVLFYEGERKPFIYIFTALAAVGIFYCFRLLFNISLPTFLGLGD